VLVSTATGANSCPCSLERFACFGNEPVQALPPLFALADQPGALEKAEVLDEAGERDGKWLGEGRRRCLEAVSQSEEDLAPRRIPESAEHRIQRVVPINNHMV